MWIHSYIKRTDILFKPVTLSVPDMKFNQNGVHYYTQFRLVGHF